MASSPEKFLDLMGKLSILYVRFWVENVPHGLLYQADVSDFVAMWVFFFQKEAENSSTG